MLYHEALCPLTHTSLTQSTRKGRSQRNSGPRSYAMYSCSPQVQAFYALHLSMMIWSEPWWFDLWSLIPPDHLSSAKTTLDQLVTLPSSDLHSQQWLQPLTCTCLLMRIIFTKTEMYVCSVNWFILSGTKLHTHTYIFFLFFYSPRTEHIWMEVC